MSDTPAAKHVVVDGHDMELSLVTPVGILLKLQVTPPSVVAMMSALPDEFEPTAKQVDVEGHVIDESLGTAGNALVTLHAGGTEADATDTVVSANQLIPDTTTRTTTHSLKIDLTRAPPG